MLLPLTYYDIYLLITVDIFVDIFEIIKEMRARIPPADVLNLPEIKVMSTLFLNLEIR